MQTAGDTTVYRTTFTSDVDLDTAAFSGNDTVYAGDGTDWVFASLGDDWVDGGTGGDVLMGQRGAEQCSIPAKTLPRRGVLDGGQVDAIALR